MNRLISEIIGAMLGHKLAGRVGVESDLGKAFFSAAGGAAGRMVHPHLEHLIRKYTQTDHQEELSAQVSLNAIVQRHIGFIAGRTVVMLISDNVFDSLERSWGSSESEAYGNVMSSLNRFRERINDEFDTRFHQNLKSAFDGFPIPIKDLGQVLRDAEGSYKSQASYYLDAVISDLEDKGGLFSK